MLDDHYANDLVALARTSDLAGARRWFTSFGSCSVTEPLDDLRRPRPAGGVRMSDRDGFGLDHLPYGVFVARAGAPRVGVRYGDPCSTSRPCGPSSTGPTLNDFMALGPGRLGRDPRRDRRAGRGRGARRRPRSTRSRCTCRSRSATTSTSTPPSTTPPTSAGSSGPTRSRCCPTGGTSRSATTAAPAPSSSAVRRSSGRAGSGRRRTRTPRPTARAGASTSRPSWASWSASAPSSAAGSASASFADHVFGVVGLNDWSRPRHPGLGVRPARPVPRQVVRDLGQRLGHAARRARRGLVRPARPGPGAAATTWLDRLDRRSDRAALDIDVEVVLNGEVVSRPPYRTMYWSPAQMLAHLTVNGASHPHRRPVRLRHHQRARARHPRLVPRAQLGRQGAVRRRPHLPRGRRRGHAALLRARHRRRPDHPRRGHRQDRAGAAVSPP